MPAPLITISDPSEIIGQLNKIWAQINVLTFGDAGDVNGPGNAVSQNIAIYGDSTGKVIIDSGYSVGSLLTGLTQKASCRVASTANLTVTYSNGTAGVGATLTNNGAQAALSIDGVSLSVADRVLIKNQSTTFQNGIYQVTTVGDGTHNWVLTRTSDYDNSIPGEIAAGTYTIITAGTTNTGTLWIETGVGPFTIGTTAITFIQLVVTGSGTVTSVSFVGDGVIFNASVSGSPVTSAGTLTPSFISQTANTLLMGPSSGGAAAPTFRALLNADLPTAFNGQSIGNSTPAAITGTTIIANTGFTGNVTGNVVGNVTGNVTGVATGNIAGGKLTATAQTSAFTLTLPANAYIQNIFIKETAGNLVLGGVKIGSSLGATDVAVAITIGANSIQIVPAAQVLKQVFSTSATQVIYFDAVTGFNAASLNVEIIYGNL